MVTVGISAPASGLADKLVPSISPCGLDLKEAIHTLQCNHKYCTVIQAAFLVFSPKTLLEYSSFLVLDYCQHLPMNPNTRLPCWPRKDCTMALFRNVPWKQCWLWKLLGTSLLWFDRAQLHPRKLTAIPQSLHLGASKNLGYLSLGWVLRLQKSLKYQQAKLHQFEHKQICLWGSREHPVKWGRSPPTQIMEKHVTSLAWDSLCGNAEPARTSSLTCPKHLTCGLPDYAFPLYHTTEEDIQAQHINSS